MTELKREIEYLDGGQLPLQLGLKASSHALDDRFEAMIISADDDTGFIQAKVGIFYSGLITGCGCADDPTPVEPQSEYCALLFTIDKATAETTVTLLGD